MQWTTRLSHYRRSAAPSTHGYRNGPPGPILPVSAAVLHTFATSLLPSGMALCKHATCGQRMQVPIRIRHEFSSPSVAAGQHFRCLWRLGGLAGNHPVRDKANVALPSRENVRPDIGGDSGGRCLHRLFNSSAIENVRVLNGGPRDSPTTRDRTPVLPRRCPKCDAASRSQRYPLRFLLPLLWQRP